MANYNNPNIGVQQMPNLMGQPQTPIQFPYGSNNMLLSNTPYDNYMGRINGSQNLLPNQFLKCRPVSSKEQARAFQIDLDTITESMEKADEKSNQGETNINYYTTPYNDRDMERTGGYMYYPTGGSMGRSGMSYYTEMPGMMSRDPREGRSPMRRRMYMEGKEMHKDTNSQLRELEAYLQELSTDITEMIKDASPEERSTLRQKMTTLASKIS